MDFKTLRPCGGHQTITGLTHSRSHSHLSQQSTCLHVFGLWEEAGEPGENPRKHGENMQTPQKGLGATPLVAKRSLFV